MNRIFLPVSDVKISGTYKLLGRLGRINEASPKSLLAEISETKHKNQSRLFVLPIVNTKRIMDIKPMALLSELKQSIRVRFEQKIF